MNDPRAALAALRDELEKLQPGDLVSTTRIADLIQKIRELENSLAARVAPARLVLALHDGDGAQDRVPVLIASTVPMIVFAVDHREKASVRLSVLRNEPLANAADLIEVVSDEVAEHAQCNPELIKLIADNCS